MDLGLRGKVALVTGASRGLGFAIANALAREGAALAINARTHGVLEEAARRIADEHGVRTLPLSGDVSAEGIPEMLVQETVRQLGGVNILVTNSGGPPSLPFEETTDGQWREGLDGLLMSVVKMCRAAVPHMKRNGWGRIIMVASIAVKQPIDGLIISNSVRASVVGLARTLANELGPSGITVNTLLPGYTRTERLRELSCAIAERQGCEPTDVFRRWERLSPLGRLGRPEELGAMAAYLASERAGFVTGTSIPVDGGLCRSLL